MKISLVDRVLNWFINTILLFQKVVFLFEEFCENKRKLKYIVIFTFIVAFVLMLIKQNYLFVIMFLLLYIVCLLYYARGWCSSARKFFKLIVFIDLFIIILGTSIFAILIPDQKVSDDFIIGLSLPIYFIIWLLLSLIARPKVARFVNEIISIITTILFTAGTYIISNTYAGYTIPKNISKALENTELFNTELLQKELSKELIKLVIYDIGNTIFLYLLPFLCISLFSLLLINVKEYWLKKKGIKDFWTLKDNKNRKVYRIRND